jgi:hypothetical protein
MLPDKEFYLVMNEAGAMMSLGDPAQDSDGRFPNQESATRAATTAWSVHDGQELYIVHHTRTVVATVSGTTDIVVTPV